MVQSWFELESDPGLFTLLVEDFGIKGVQVEEIYDLDTVSDMGAEPLGFIFLFRWIEDRRRRRKLMNETHLCVKEQCLLENMFFAHQVIPNSCATHALLSILLNSENESVSLPEELQKLKTSTKGMTPDQKGTAIGSLPNIADAHNSHASPHLRLQQENKSTVPGASQTGEAYHYVSYLPIDGHLYEMDGLKPWPLDHGKFDNQWTQKFSDVITERLGGGDIMFNLMAVVPDRRIKYKTTLGRLKTNWECLASELRLVMKLWKESIPDPMKAVLPTNQSLTLKEWLDLLKVEHNYILPQAAVTESPESSPIKEKPIDPTISYQVEELINSLSEMDESCTSEVIVQQEDNSKQTVTLQELSDFDPCLLTHVKAMHSTSNGDSEQANSFSLQELLEMLTDLKSHIAETEQQLKEQEDLRDKYKIDVCRRTHNYYPFITTFLRMLAEQGMLVDMVNQLTQPKKKSNAPIVIPAPVPSSVAKSKKRQVNDSKAKTKKTKKRK